MAECRSCHAPIRWEITAKGKRTPVDVETGEPHWATCPEAKSWKKPAANT